MLAMPGFILWAAKRLKLAPWLVATVSAVLAVIAAWGLIALLIHRHDKRVVGAYENGVQAQVNTEVATGTNVADAQANVTAAKDNEAAVQIQEDIHNATVAHPVDSARPVGPVSQSVLNRLRNRPH